jgi:epoxyqueuosine reductase
MKSRKELQATVLTVTSNEETLRNDITEEIKSFVHVDPGNRLELDGQPIYAEPLIGFASGSDPLFKELKGVIGDFHLTPHEAMQRAALSRNFEPSPEEITGVISFVLPMHRLTVKENAGMTDRPSRRWVHGRFHGEPFRNRLADHIISFLNERGLIAIAPENETSFYVKMIDPRIGYTSNWSQRHIAYAAGLGSFGLSDGLITEAGIAEAVGSVVVNVPFTSPERTGDIHANCLYFQKGTCKACASRCPAGAITVNGHDKNKCAKFAFSQTPLNKDRYGIDIYSCGLCLSGVPCSMRDPVSISPTSLLIPGTDDERL